MFASWISCTDTRLRKLPPFFFSTNSTYVFFVRFASNPKGFWHGIMSHKVTLPIIENVDRERKCFSTMCTIDSKCRETTLDTERLEIEDDSLLEEPTKSDVRGVSGHSDARDMKCFPPFFRGLFTLTHFFSWSTSSVQFLCHWCKDFLISYRM